MKSIRSVYKIGNGPSSSHTVGPYNAAKLFRKRYPDADGFSVTLYGSLAYTGEGHGTGKAIRNVLPEAEILFRMESEDLPHPNTMDFRALKDGSVIGSARIFSIGGGSIRIEGEVSDDEREVYPQTNFTDMLEKCRADGLRLIDFIYRMEGDSLKTYLREIWEAMQRSVQNGLAATGILPGGLGVSRKAKLLYEKRCYNEDAIITQNRLMSAYAFAVSEENASERVVVTAPTCGSCGVIPAVMYYLSRDRGIPDEEIIDALAVAGLIGNVIRTNASISGAECGCQAEIGSACSMAAGGYASLLHMNLEQIEYAAEVAMEHNLGLTCDPVKGLVQIPCIERNSVAAMRAFSCVNLAHFLTETRKVSFDEVVATMYQTGKDMSEKYRETSHGGLAAMYDQKHGGN
ncbi:MAG: L-serine ammonia-lyase, iron-sulfur-dependent, subunit alpha [Clostridia bacterium]|nr:L-serine ammonia-lyase, iron-sulfur-dependent, subunit alpha [Clostridia bacterium]